MAQPGGPTPQQIAQMQQQVAMEAARRGMTPQEFQAMQRKAIEEEAKKAGMPLEQYIAKIKQQAWEQHQQLMKAQAEQQAAQAAGGPMVQGNAQGAPQGQQQQQVPIQPGAPNPSALALAKWLRSQDLKSRTCILNGQRKDMFKVKRALRAIRSPAYEKAQKKDKLLPKQPTTDAETVEVFKLLPLSLLALRVSKVDPHEGHNHGGKAPKRVKGLWTVKIEQQQDISDMLHYVWLYDGPQWRQRLYAAGALLAIMTVVMFPLWPIKLRIGVWYLSMSFLGLIGLFFAMSIFRLILFCATVLTLPRGLWLYPNLFEDVGFFDSFRPVWAWQEKGKKGKSKKVSGEAKTGSKKSKKSSATSSPAADSASKVKSIHAAPRVEEVTDE